ncbi:MAG: SUMF1/EgtB/PvdO family nonheme iron enzyme [Candidatus Eisenbacteria bacterium]|nr:SUMF1/EgtB/PvdO family nonheme iron enzyme [Candidatus Eisenbacteria bacterium]
MTRRIIVILVLALAMGATATQSEWLMRIHRGDTTDDYVIAEVDSITFADVSPLPPGFVLIPSGSFTMGSPEDEYGHESDEVQHTVTLTTPFYLSSTEVTNQQYADLAQWAYGEGYCTATSSSLRDALDGSTQELLDLDDGDCEISFGGGVFTVDAGKESHPVLEVTWYGSAAYCDWLSLSEGLARAYDHATWECNGHDPYNAAGYRLPTEAEWEYACGAGTATPFHTGTCLDAGTEANYDGNYPYPGCPSGPYVGWTVPVGSYPSNGFGLYDMHGNVWDWCNDRYGVYGGDETDPVGPAAGSRRVRRGGRWGNYAQDCRSAYRYHYYPDYSSYSRGFRLARSAD